MIVINENVDDKKLYSLATAIKRGKEVKFIEGPLIVSKKISPCTEKGTS